MICSRAPVRISFVGGGTDVSPFTEMYGSAVLNVTINKYTYTNIEKNEDDKIKLMCLGPERKIEFGKSEPLVYDGNLDISKCVLNSIHDFNSPITVKTYSDVPVSSGLGGSAAMFVSLIGALNRFNKRSVMENYDIAELAYKMEREDLKNLGGRQDQYATVFGGLNYIEFKGNDFVRVNPVKLERDILLELERSMIMFYIGPREKKSGNIIADQTKNVLEKGEVIEMMKLTKELTMESKVNLLRGNIEEFGRNIDRAWELKKKFSEKITNRRIDNIYERMKGAGAIGGKISGAGGGGHMFFICPPEKRYKLLKTAKSQGIEHIPFSFEFEGMTTWRCK